MGASRLRLIWQLMTESMLLAIGSGFCALLLAYWFVRAAAVFKPPMDVPLKIDLHLDYRVLIFTFLVSVLTGILIGLLPALQTTKIDLQNALKDKTSFATYKRSFMKNGLIVFQVMLSLILLIGAGLMSRALQRAYSVNLGFDPQNAVAVTFDLRLQGYDDARGREFQKQLLQRLRSIPGVQAAGIIDLVPVDLHFTRTPVFVEGQPIVRALQAPHVMTSRITPGYFDAMSTRIVRGRDFTDQDDVNSQPVAIINETFAKRYWPDQDPIGKRFIADGPEQPKLQIVGVVQDGKYGGLNEKQQMYFCRPLSQVYLGSSTVIVRTNTAPQRMIPVVRKEIEKLDPYMPLSSAKTMVEKMAAPLMPARIAAYVLGAFGILALLLAAIGIYGVMSYAVSTRTQEIGVRVALGAKAADVLKLTIIQGMTLVIVGAVLGVGIALALTKFTRSMLFGLSSADPLTYTLVAVLLMFVALLACYIPARRAAKIDPIVALRYE
jgi:predicted permease